MFKTKNLTPQQIALFNAGVISVLVALAFLIIHHTWWSALISLVLTFGVSYNLIFYSLQNFIYRKVKLIYKFIYQTKASKREEFYYKNILPQKTIEEVSEDVEKWALQRRAEIEVLKQNENFRKEFLQNLSHELKTPIFAIQGYIDTLLNGAMNNPEVHKKFLENASKNVDRLVNLVDDLDEISKLESGHQQLNKETFAIQELIREVYDSLSLRASDKQIKASIKKGCEAPLTVLADKEKIRQVLINLVDNAIKYGRTSGSIIASIYKTDGKHALVEISDDGIGIAEEHLNRIFERFYRTDAARSRKQGGSGLGLAICKHIVEAHGQVIHVRSKPDIGTTFGFTLEMAK
ncbi:sensor histidine kinase [Dinghuibacter silviterrae]|uniref:histidine kinase n=1 Tax=Dinghuibacter silviterrae TaxID=1539049 RepID=A0A4R8DPS6_9BACT|nr:ATP-binding protein [Dinghuibacter silviterrae]TDX00130.1 two-component system phosphate regulon sensor histidine kinase PhoR [Dinghuibacter silviterrae]